MSAPGTGVGSQVHVWGGTLGMNPWALGTDPLIPSRLGLLGLTGTARPRDAGAASTETWLCVALVAKCCRLQNFCELRWGWGTAVLGRGEISCLKAAI